MKYVFSVVRFVPDPVRGEYVNLGAIAGSDESSDWQIRQIENPIRGRAIDERKSLEAVWAFMDEVGRGIDDFERARDSLFEPDVQISEAWLERLQATRRNVVQLSDPTPMVAVSAEEALDRVFDLFILDPAQRRFRFQKKNVALAAVRAAYLRHFLRTGRDVKERGILATSAHRERLDFAVANGEVVQLAHTWSFQVPDQETLAEQVKAWGWTILDLRQHGGELALGDEKFATPRDVDVEVVYVPPAEGHEAPAWVDAANVFKELNVTFAPVDEIERVDRVGEAALQLLVAAGARLDIRPERA